MSSSRLKSYEYNVICPVCGFEKKNYELQQRWDGLWVCKDDWEPRNILDLYRNRPDAHQLPFTFPDTDADESNAPDIRAPATFPNEIARGTWATASASDYTNSRNYAVRFFIYGGEVSKIEKNDDDQYLTYGVIYLEPTDTLTITYTSAPSYVEYR